jgi:HlyD family secretion protein
MRRFIVIAVLVAATALAGWRWWVNHQEAAHPDLILYGNVDLRQVDLAFNNSERIAAVLVQEGDHVRRGQLVAKLDTSRLEPQVAQAAAMVESQRQVVTRLKNGSRPEEIAQARANVESAKADLENAKQHYERFNKLAPKMAVSQDELLAAKAVLDVAQAKLAVNQKALDLAVIGPRQEDILQAEAQLRANEAQLALLRQQLADAQLFAPSDAVVRTRLLEPGDMATPQKPVFSLAIIDPKWVRAYVDEPNLGKLYPGMRAWVECDSFKNQRFTGWVGFISPIAEFTPKQVQTPELRTSLVYEVRVFVNDPGDRLRLGMPATVILPLDQTVPSIATPHSATTTAISATATSPTATSTSTSAVKASPSTTALPAAGATSKP